ncbi:hypothetical protein D0A34_14790 [Microcoleus vaginatus PCC 9802]|nr:hypothetical protein D0A34_14790 [Microcoleus vaginatus PCC 9802]
MLKEEVLWKSEEGRGGEWEWERERRRVGKLPNSQFPIPNSLFCSVQFPILCGEDAFRPNSQFPIPHSQFPKDIYD